MQSFCQNHQNLDQDQLLALIQADRTSSILQTYFGKTECKKISSAPEEFRQTPPLIEDELHQVVLQPSLSQEEIKEDLMIQKCNMVLPVSMPYVTHVKQGIVDDKLNQAQKQSVSCLYSSEGLQKMSTKSVLKISNSKMQSQNSNTLIKYSSNPQKQQFNSVEDEKSLAKSQHHILSAKQKPYQRKQSSVFSKISEEPIQRQTGSLFRESKLPQARASSGSMSIKKFRAPMSRKVTRTESCTSVKNPFGLRKVNQYIQVKKIGVGAYGDVYMVIDPSKENYPAQVGKPNNQQTQNEEDKTYAMKIIKKDKLPSIAGNKLLLNEVEVLKNLHHPNIVHLVEVIDDPGDGNLYLVMQYLPGQSLQGNLDELEELDQVTPICQIKLWARQMMSALYKCHVQARVIHRDIKPENMMLNGQNEIVLVDFGLSKNFEGENDQLKGTAGTIKFYAPEIVRTGIKNKVIHGKQIDVWATGITLYTLATGSNPFIATTVMEMQEQLLHTDIDFEKIITRQQLNQPNEVNYQEGEVQQFIQFLKKLLEKDPLQRATVLDLMEDQWLTDGGYDPIIVHEAMNTDSESQPPTPRENEPTCAQLRKVGTYIFDDLDKLSECEDESCSLSGSSSHNKDSSSSFDYEEESDEFQSPRNDSKQIDVKSILNLTYNSNSRLGQSFRKFDFVNQSVSSSERGQLNFSASPAIQHKQISSKNLSKACLLGGFK